MKKLNKSIVIIIVIALIAIIGLGFATYMILHDENKLSVEEKEWLAANINTVQNVHVLNNIDVFGLKKIIYNKQKIDIESINNIDYEINIKVKVEREELIFNSLGENNEI